MKKVLLIITASVFLGTCQIIQEEEDQANITDKIVGEWVFKLLLDDASIPFNAVLSVEKENLVMYVNNGDESIKVEDIILKRDSIFIQMPFFNSRFFGKLKSDSLIEGFWVDDSRPDNYRIPFKGFYGLNSRFDFDKNNALADYNGSWKIVFDPNSDDSCNAIGIFHQEGNQIEGTVLTETGDHRFLQGNVSGNIINLSCFDGAHAFLYSGVKDENENIHGILWSGKHFTTTWIGEKNNTFKLRHPDSLTYLKNESNIMELEFQDFDNHRVSFSDDQFKNKVLIIQIMGTWCPNCLDESVVFNDFYSAYNDQGLEIVAITYERGNDMDVIAKTINRYKKQVGLKYPFLYGGTSSKALATEQFNMLSDIIAFPTSIIVDRNGKVRKIHTGFYGPGTGEHYLDFIKDISSFIETLLGEELISS